MDELTKLNILKALLNQSKVDEICYKSKSSVLFKLSNDTRVYIDATPSGVDFSVEAMTDEANALLDKFVAE